MKKTLTLIALLLCVLQFDALAQYTSRPKQTYSGQTKLYLGVDGGYFIGGKINDYSYNSFNVDNALSYSISLGFTSGRNKEMELKYIGTNPSARVIDRYGNNDSGPLSTNYHYMQLGFINYLDLGALRPFYIISAGASYMKMGSDYNSHDDLYKFSQWSFATTFGLGVKIDVTNKFGIKLQGSLIMPMSFTGLGFNIGVGTGGFYPSFSLNSYSIMFHGDLSAGIYLKF